MLKPTTLLWFLVLFAVGFLATKYFQLWSAIFIVNAPISLVVSSVLVGSELPRTISKETFVFIALVLSYLGWISLGSLLGNKIYH
jgi:hypothetical protein